MNRQKGLILKRENEDCLVLTPDGMFRSVRSSGKAQVGEEIFLSSGAAGFKRILLVAASMCLLAFCCLFYQTNIAQAVTFVSFDFNPSLEIGLNRYKEIVSIKAFDDDAEKMLEKVNIKGQTVDRAVKIIINQARTEGYLVSSSKETLLVAVSPAKEGAAQKVTAEEIAGLANQYLIQNGVEATIITSAASPKNHQEAGEKKISLGRYILLEAAKKEGKEITPQEIKEQKLSDIEAKHGLNLKRTFSNPNSGTKQFVAGDRPVKKQAAEKIKQQYLKKKKSEINKKPDSYAAQQKE
ncbi:MAG: putative membrane protein [Desulfotomaculum sp. 46_296]|nr:MAG: putative membrane protein [Desulfotomaculum sp. 46_296]